MVLTTLTNCQLCIGGKLIPGNLTFSNEDGLFTHINGPLAGEIVDMGGAIVSPGFLDLHTNGMLGFHFTHFVNEEQYESSLDKVSKHLLSRGVVGFWATLPTVPAEEYKKILPCLGFKEFLERGATLLGAHVEGPFLHHSKKGAHNAELFKVAQEVSVEALYGEDNLKANVKLVTIAPEQPGSDGLVRSLSQKYGCRVSLGHSSATYEQGMESIKNGATALTHVFNAMNPLHHRNPGLAGLISALEISPYYTLIADGIHLHPATLAMALRANPRRCIVITDSVELAGLPDGIYPGHSQISSEQEKLGDRVTIRGTETLIGGCSSLDKCIQNLISWKVCSLAEAVMCVSENVADMMGLQDRGKLERCRRADFTVLDDGGNVLETWIGGRKVWSN